MIRSMRIKTIENKDNDAVKIEEQLVIADNTGKQSKLEYLKAGQMLLEKKALVGHGNWLHWMLTNMPQRNQRTLERYMRMAEMVKSDSGMSVFDGAENMTQ